MKKYFLLFFLFAFVCSFNIIQRIAKFRDEHLKILLQKEEAKENIVQPIQKEVPANTTTITAKPPIIKPTPAAKITHRAKPRYRRTTYRRKKRDL